MKSGYINANIVSGCKVTRHDTKQKKKNKKKENKIILWFQQQSICYIEKSTSLSISRAKARERAREN